MRTHFVALTMASLGLGLSATTSGAETSTASPPPELKQFDWFLGTWKCTGTTFASPMEKEHATESTLTIQNDLDGFWQSFTVEEAKTAANPTPVKGAGHGGYDRALKKFVRVGFNNHGRWSSWTSTGWAGDRVVFVGAAGAKDVQLRQTITKKGDNAFDSVVEAKGAGGKWAKAAETSCKK